MNKALYFLSISIIVLAIITSGFGLFYTTDDQSFDFVNQYGDTIKIYGNGIYKNDSYFMAQIFKGTDCMVLFLAIPLLVIALIMDIKVNILKTKLFLTGIIIFFLYYSVSYSIGAIYNVLHLLYIALFSCSLFASVIGYGLLKNHSIKTSRKINTTGLKIFLIFCGLSLFVAWLPDIIVSLINKKSLELIEIYTTQITYVLDMAIISPTIFICLYNLSKSNNIGYILLGIILNMLVMTGIMVIFQTIIPAKAGIELPVGAIITKVGIFVVLAIIAIYYEIKLFINIQGSGNENKEGKYGKTICNH
jgi:hypothetical protein